MRFGLSLAQVIACSRTDFIANLIPMKQYIPAFLVGDLRYFEYIFLCLGALRRRTTFRVSFAFSLMQNERSKTNNIYKMIP